LFEDDHTLFPAETLSWLVWYNAQVLACTQHTLIESVCFRARDQESADDDHIQSA